VSLLALCYHSRCRRAAARSALAARLAAAQGAGGAGTELVQGLPIGGMAPGLPPGARLGVVAAESPSGRHIIILGVPPGGGYGAAAASLAAAARSRELLPNGKLPTPASVIANLPTYLYEPPPGEAVAAAGAAAGAEANGSAAARAGKAGGSDEEGGDAEGSGRPMCVICCEEFKAGTRVKVLPCMHRCVVRRAGALVGRDRGLGVDCKKGGREDVLRAAPAPVPRSGATSQAQSAPPPNTTPPPASAPSASTRGWSETPTAPPAASRSRARPAYPTRPRSTWSSQLQRPAARTLLRGAGRSTAQRTEAGKASCGAARRIYGRRRRRSGCGSWRSRGRARARARRSRASRASRASRGRGDAGATQ
jgi:hypothetical protein